MQDNSFLMFFNLGTRIQFQKNSPTFDKLDNME